MSTRAIAQGLSPARRRLVELVRALTFGRIEGLVVRNGEPVLDPPPRTVREHKFLSPAGPAAEPAPGDPTERPQVRDLLRLLDAVGDGVIETLTVKHGLPFHAELPG